MTVHPWPGPGWDPMGDLAQQVECRYGSFVRRLTLSSPIDPDRIRATYKDGVLDVRVPKPVGSQARRVAIEAA